ncbi:MAG: hypothetical protein Q9225_007179 [Loekoesia sp. 1 TL-2023]
MHFSPIIIAAILTCVQCVTALPVAEADTNTPAASNDRDGKTPATGGEDGLHTWHPPLPPRLVCDWPMTFKRCSEWTNQGWAFAPGAYCGWDATPGFRNPEGRDKNECARLCRCEPGGRTDLKGRKVEGATEKENYTVFALDITIGQDLKKLSCESFECDLSSAESIAQFSSHFNSLGEPLDILLNIAGVMAPKSKDVLESVSSSTLLSTFQTNTFGPLLLTQGLLPSILRAKSPKIAHMSSRVGSIADNTSGGGYSYRASKAALNSIGKSMAMDLKDKGVVVLLLHPGYVITGLIQDGEMEKNPEAVMPEEAAGKLWEVVKKKGLTETGTFWHREGFELPW